MAVMEIALEIGSSETSIFLSGSGIVLREPTVIAFTGEPKQRNVRAVGEQASAMVGKTPDRTIIVSPVVDGFIVNAEACGVLLKEFIKKILPSSYIFAPKIKAILGVPTGLTIEERKMYEDVCFFAGISEITMIENIILSGIGIDLPISSNCGGLVVNIGGGITEIAVLSLCGVISGCGVSIGGNMMDNALLDYIVGRYNIKLGINTVRKLKTDIGSLCENDISMMTVNGVNTKTKSPAAIDIFAADIYEALKPYYLRIADAVESIINMCPPEIASDLYKSGIYCVGGGSMILGLDKFLEKRLKLNAYVPEDPVYASILGAGKLLSNPGLLRDILSQK